jgi:hypothetical protein
VRRSDGRAAGGVHRRRTALTKLRPLRTMKAPSRLGGPWGFIGAFVAATGSRAVATERAMADELLAWLLEPLDGVAHARARRLGIVEIIWFDHRWSSQTKAWLPYTLQGCPDPAASNTGCIRSSASEALPRRASLVSRAGSVPRCGSRSGAASPQLRLRTGQRGRWTAGTSDFRRSWRHSRWRIRRAAASRRPRPTRSWLPCTVSRRLP